MRIGYVGNFRFPEADVGAVHVYGIGRALRWLGHEVVFLGEERSGRIAELTLGDKYVYDGFRYVPRLIQGRAKGAGASIIALDVLARLKSLGGSPLEVVVLYGGFSIGMLRIMKWCRRAGIAHIVDAVDWLDPSHLPLGSFGPWRAETECRIRVVQPRARRVICISRWLEQYYEARGCATLRVPPLASVGAAEPTVENATQINSIRFVYAGTPGRKDLLGNVLRGVSQLRSSGVNATISLIGVPRETAQACLGKDARGIQALDQALVCKDRVPPSRVREMLADADFMPLLRPNLRYAQAGFPTKVVESFAAGVPVVANVTGDLGLHLVDSVNSFVARDHTVDAFVHATHRALAMREQWPAMRRAARLCAARSFDYRVHAERLGAFLEEAVFEVGRRSS